VTGFPNPATNFIVFIPGGERREEEGSKYRFRLFFPRSRLLPSNPIRELSIGGTFCYSAHCSLIYRPDPSGILGPRSCSQVNPRIQKSGRGTGSIDFVARWGRRHGRLLRSARLRSHDALLYRGAGSRRSRSIGNTAWQEHAFPPGPRSSGHPMVGYSVNMVKCAVIMMQVRSPSF